MGSEPVVPMDPEDYAAVLTNEVHYQLHVRNDPGEADAVFRRGIEKHPGNATIVLRYARFLSDRHRPDEAEAVLTAGVAASPNDGRILCGYARFLWDVRADADRADAYYRRAIAAPDPEDRVVRGVVRHSFPHHITHLESYAVFLEIARHDSDGTEACYRRLIEELGWASHIRRYALYLHTVRQDFDRAETEYRRAVNADPLGALNLGNFAVFLQTVRRDADEAEAYFIRAVAADPEGADHEILEANYRFFLNTVRHEAEASDARKRASEAEPNVLACFEERDGYLLEIWARQVGR